MRSLLLISTVIAASTMARHAHGQDADAVRKVRIVIPTARGRKPYGIARLSKTLREAIGEGVGTVLPAADFRRAQRRLRLPRRKRWTRSAIARAGREIGADYVLYTRITRKGWLYTARARLVNTATNEVQMDFRSQYYDPAKEAGDRGQRIGRRTLLKMQTLAEEGRLLATGAPAADAPQPPLVPLTPPGDSASPPAQRAEREGYADLTVGGASTDVPDRPSMPEPALAPSTTPRRAPRPAPAAPPPTPSVVAATEPPAGAERFRIDLSGGAGLLRRYDVSSANVDDSGLSYPLEPTSLFRAGVELRVPGTPLGFDVDVAFRPVRYEVGPIGRMPDEPSGMIINSGLWAAYHFRLAGTGRTAVRLFPKVGARLEVASVEQHATNFVVSTTAVTIGGGLGFRWPVNRTLELGGAVDGGLLASYSEDPETSGDLQRGFSVSGDLEVRFWLSDVIGVAFDSRYRYAQASFSGVPTRRVPDSERDQLENLTVTTQDLLTSIGVALRF